jgi:hypothetical protein
MIFSKFFGGDGPQEIEQEYPKLQLPASTSEQNPSSSSRSMGILQMRRHRRNDNDGDRPAAALPGRLQ